MARNPKVAVLCIGIMGAAMTGDFLEADMDINVWNRPPDKAAPLAERGRRRRGLSRCPALERESHRRTF